MTTTRASSFCEAVRIALQSARGGQIHVVTQPSAGVFVVESQADAQRAGHPAMWNTFAPIPSECGASAALQAGAHTPTAAPTSTASLCAAVQHATGTSLVGAPPRLVPKVIIARADANRIAGAVSTDRFPDHSVVLRTDAQRTGVRIVWDPYPGREVGMEPGIPNIPPACRLGAAVGQSIATSVGVGVVRSMQIALGLGGLIVLGAAAWFGYRYFKRRRR